MKAGIQDVLLETLEDRFKKNMPRHAGIDWSSVKAKLEAGPEKLQRSLKWKKPAVNRM